MKYFSNARAGQRGQPMHGLNAARLIHLVYCTGCLHVLRSQNCGKVALMCIVIPNPNPKLWRWSCIHTAHERIFQASTHVIHNRTRVARMFLFGTPIKNSQSCTTPKIRFNQTSYLCNSREILPWSLCKVPVALRNATFNAFTFLVVSRTSNVAEITRPGLSRVHPQLRNRVWNVKFPCSDCEDSAA